MLESKSTPPTRQFMNRISFRAKALLLAVSFIAAQASQAMDYVWTNRAGGSWTVAANWSPNGVPGAADIARITNAGNYAVVIAGSAAVAELDLGTPSGATVQTLTISSNTVLVVNGLIVGTPQGQFWNSDTASLAGSNFLTGTVSWNGGAFSNLMTIATNSVLNVTSVGNPLNFYSPNLTNNGTLNLSNLSMIAGYSGGQICNNGLWSMQGNIFFNGTATATSFINCGTFLSLGSNVVGNFLLFTNVGMVTVQSGFLSAAQFTSIGGDLNGGGLFELAGITTLYGPIRTANIEIADGLAQLYGAIAGADFKLNGGNFFGHGVVFDGTFTHQGGTLNGQFTVSSNSFLNLAESAFTASPAYFFDLTITNFGTVIWKNTDLSSYEFPVVLFNYGIWDAQTDNTFFGKTGFSPPNLSVFYNFGAFRKSGSSGGATVFDHNIAFVNHGSVAVLRGTLTFGGSFAETSTGDLSFFLGAPTSGNSYGQISLAQPVDLLGTLTVQTEDGFIPAAGDIFQVLSYPSYTGAFDCLKLDLGDGILLQPQFDQNGLSLAATAYTVAGPQPQLRVSSDGNNLRIRWPLGFPDWALQSSPNLLPSAWSVVPGLCGNEALIPIVGPSQFFRLQKSN